MVNKLHNNAGTHDITHCSATKNVADISISAIFIQNSNATGALFSFIFFDESDGSVDLSKSSHQTFNRSDVSRGLLLPLNFFHPGLYMVYVYDIEDDKELQNGIGYTACNLRHVIINGGS